MDIRTKFAISIWLSIGTAVLAGAVYYSEVFPQEIEWLLELLIASIGAIIFFRVWFGGRKGQN